jgi:nitrogen fixation NifU-like protein
MVFAAIVPKGYKFLRNVRKRQLVPGWYHAENLKKGDIAIYPILKKAEDKLFLDISIPKLKYDFKSFITPNKIEVNDKLLRLFGYFLAEGNIQEKPSKNYISFTLNIKERDIATDIKKICSDLFNLKVKSVEIPERKTVRIFLYNARLARWFKKLFGNGAENKKIPDFVMNLPVEKQKALIFGLWKGDGSVNIQRKGARAGYVTISYQLSQQIKTLLLRQGIVPSMYFDKRRIIKGVKHRESYRIHIGQRDSLKKICKILDLNYEPKSYSIIDSWFDDNYLYTPITSKNIIDYSGRVNNLEVNDARSFVSEAFCLHNCGDMMYAYIKVGKNKKGKEILSDIKVKTFGCVAAIATSSMITDLAMGKTLEEAKKITRDNVKDALDDLPPIKVHCSNLAADALHKAIEDYEKKNKK